MDLTIHVCAHKALHGAKGSGDGKQRKLVCDQGGARDRCPCATPFQHKTQSLRIMILDSAFQVTRKVYFSMQERQNLVDYLVC